MSITLQKPRWEAWENACIQTAFAQKIQHKIMAAALGRSVSAISKKIKILGLRAPSAMPGRIKGQKQALSQKEKITTDLTKMNTILKTYAPLKCFQKGQLALKKGCWTKPQPSLQDDQSKEAYRDPLNAYCFPFSFVKSLCFTSSIEPITKGMEVIKVQGEPAYVPLYYVDQWAVSEGFHKTKGALLERGLAYWKDGIYFSQTQLLMHVNHLRFKHNLQPIALLEEEGESPD